MYVSAVCVVSCLTLSAAAVLFAASQGMKKSGPKTIAWSASDTDQLRSSLRHHFLSREHQ